jgi:MFS family permease
MRRAWAATLILAALSTFSFLDRQVLALLIPDLKRDLHITDVQFGLLTGPAFILVYNVILVAAALVVDRWNRKWLICIGAVVWTLMTMGSALARSFDQLLLMRGGLAFGEALLGPAAISLIGDLFERLERPLPTAAYITGSVIGSTGSAMISALVLQIAHGVSSPTSWTGHTAAWRLTLVGVGLPGLLLGLALVFVAREPGRRTDTAAPVGAGLEPLAAHLRRRGLLYLGIFTGYGLLGMISTALAIWGPAYIMRGFHIGQVSSGYWLGAVSLIGGLCGTAVLPAIFRAQFRRGQVNRVVGLAVAAMAAAAVAAAVGSLSPVLWTALVGFGAAMFLVMGVGTLPTLIIQLYAPSHLRGRISAALFFTLYLLSSGLAPVLVPTVAHGVFRGDGSLGPSIALISVVAVAAAAIMFLVARPTLKRAEAEFGGGAG